MFGQLAMCINPSAQYGGAERILWAVVGEHVRFTTEENSRGYQYGYCVEVHPETQTVTLDWYAGQGVHEFLTHGVPWSLVFSGRLRCSGRSRGVQTLDATQPLASRVAFQLDKTAPAHQEVSGHKRERTKDANLVCRVHLRAHCHS